MEDFGRVAKRSSRAPKGIIQVCAPQGIATLTIRKLSNAPNEIYFTWQAEDRLCMTMAPWAILESLFIHCCDVEFRLYDQNFA